MDETKVIIQDVDSESIVKNFYCAYHGERNEVVAVIAFHDEGFSVFWSDLKTPVSLQLEVITKARVMFGERL